MKKLLKSLLMDVHIHTSELGEVINEWTKNRIEASKRIHFNKESMKKEFTKKTWSDRINAYCSRIDSKYDKYFGDEIVVEIEKLSNGYNVRKYHLGVLLDQRGFYFCNAPEELRVIYAKGMKVGDVKTFNIYAWNNIFYGK